DEEKKIRAFHITQYGAGSEDKPIFLCYLNPVFFNDKKLMHTSCIKMDSDKYILPGFDVYELSRITVIDGPVHLRNFAVNRKTKEGFFIADNLENYQVTNLNKNMIEAEKYKETGWRGEKTRAIRFNRVAMDCGFNIADEKQAIQIAEKYILLSYNHDVFLSDKLPSPKNDYRYVWLEYCHDHPDFRKKYKRFEKTPQAKKMDDGSYEVEIGAVKEFSTFYTLPDIFIKTVKVNQNGLIYPIGTEIILNDEIADKTDWKLLLKQEKYRKRYEQEKNQR
ncbi:MAG: hypothetical protein LWY06_14545, partial [Firmicutes bacterium]|nr:hypothetical protein [Bacillota bacterium]